MLTLQKKKSDQLQYFIWFHFFDYLEKYIFTSLQNPHSLSGLSGKKGRNGSAECERIEKKSAGKVPSAA